MTLVSGHRAKPPPGPALAFGTAGLSRLAGRRPRAEPLSAQAGRRRPCPPPARARPSPGKIGIRARNDSARRASLIPGTAGGAAVSPVSRPRAGQREPDERRRRRSDARGAPGPRGPLGVEPRLPTGGGSTPLGVWGWDGSPRESGGAKTAQRVRFTTARPAGGDAHSVFLD